MRTPSYCIAVDRNRRTELFATAINLLPLFLTQAKLSLRIRLVFDCYSVLLNRSFTPRPPRAQIIGQTRGARSSNKTILRMDRKFGNVSTWQLTFLHFSLLTTAFRFVLLPPFVCENEGLSQFRKTTY